MGAQAAEAELRAVDVAKRARAEADARVEEARSWNADGAGLDARVRGLLQENRSMAAELQLHISVRPPPLSAQTCGHQGTCSELYLEAQTSDASRCCVLLP